MTRVWALVVLAASGAGVAAAQPPEGTVDSAPAVSMPALPEALRARVVQGRAEPFVGPVIEEAEPPADPAPDAVPAADVVVGQDPEASAPGMVVVEQDPEASAPGLAEPAGPVAEDVPVAPAADSPVPPRPVMGAESDLSLAAQAAALLGGTLDPAASAGERVALGGGAADLAQSLARAVFAAPVAGSIPYVVQAQVHHDVMLIFPVEWSLVQVFVGDPRRWAVTHAGPLVVLKPGGAPALRRAPSPRSRARPPRLETAGAEREGAGAGRLDPEVSVTPRQLHEFPDRGDSPARGAGGSRGSG